MLSSIYLFLVECHGWQLLPSQEWIDYLRMPCMLTPIFGCDDYEIPKDLLARLWQVNLTLV